MNLNDEVGQLGCHLLLVKVDAIVLWSSQSDCEQSSRAAGRSICRVKSKN